MSLAPTGSIAFWLNHAHRDWSTNGANYKFRDLDQEGILVRSSKHSDKTISIHFARPRDRLYDFRHPVPPCGPDGLLVTFVWTPDKVTLHLNDKLVETKDI